MVRRQTLLLQMRTSKFLPNNFHLHLGWWHKVSESQPQKPQGCLYLRNHRHGSLFFALTSFWNPWLLEDVSAAVRCIFYWKMYQLLEDVSELEDVSVAGRFICCWKMYQLVEDVSAARVPVHTHLQVSLLSSLSLSYLKHPLSFCQGQVSPCCISMTILFFRGCLAWML